jgi:hypothetical protein
MAFFIYRCPNTGLNVQGWVADDLSSKGQVDAYKALTCTACTRVNFVIPKTGKVLGADEEK